MDLKIEVLGIRIHHWMIGLLIILFPLILFDVHFWGNFLYTLYSSGTQLFLDDIKDFISFLKNVSNKFKSKVLD